MDLFQPVRNTTSLGNRGIYLIEDGSFMAGVICRDNQVLLLLRVGKYSHRQKWNGRLMDMNNIELVMMQQPRDTRPVPQRYGYTSHGAGLRYGYRLAYRNNVGAPFRVVGARSDYPHPVAFFLQKV